MALKRKPVNEYFVLDHEQYAKVLYAFRCRREEWFSNNWDSDDSDDPDYVTQTVHTKTALYQHMPVESGINSHISMAEASRRKNERKAQKLCVHSKIFTSVKDGRWQTHLPVEVLTKIFSYALLEEGIVAFSAKMAKVCSAWGKVAKNSSLWKEVDLSTESNCQTENKFLKLCKSGTLFQTEELSFSGWGSKLTAKGIEAIIESCPHLISLNLRSCNAVTSESLQNLIEKCPNLACLDLAAVTKYQSKKLSPASVSSLKCIVDTCGERLTHLSVAENPLLNFNSFIKSLAVSCPNLQLLDASNVCCRLNTIFLPLELFQHGCPRLKVLRLANNFMYLSRASESEQNEAPGFPHLEELSLAAYYGNGLSDNDLIRILKNSNKLLLLDLRGCQVFTARALLSIPATDVKYLYISKSSVTATPNIESVMKRWFHSLKELDISWCMNSTILNLCVMTFATKCKLEKLELTGTSIDIFTVKRLLAECHSLRSLNLQSCRGLPRGMKQFVQDDELKNFRLRVKGYFDAFQDEVKIYRQTLDLPSVSKRTRLSINDNDLL